MTTPRPKIASAIGPTVSISDTVALVSSHHPGRESEGQRDNETEANAEDAGTPREGVDRAERIGVVMLSMVVVPLVLTVIIGRVVRGSALVTGQIGGVRVGRHLPRIVADTKGPRAHRLRRS